MYCKFTPIFLLYVLIGDNRANCNSIADDNDVDGYYWRDYTFEIPKDALPGGTNAQGATTYIGQILHKEQLIPAKIDSVSKQAYYEWGYQEYNPAEGTQPIKILCTNHPEQFEWLTTGNGLIQYLQNKHIVKGGYETGGKLYIGRKELDGELAVGKVIHGPNQSTLNTTKDGKGTQHATFDVLVYNPAIPKRKQKNTSVTSVSSSANSGGGTPVMAVNESCVQHQITINYFT